MTSGEIPSSGTAGPHLADTFASRDNNAYATLTGEADPELLARKFLNDGWRARKASLAEFEVEHDWARIELFETDGKLMLAGFVDPDRVETLADILQLHGLGYAIELWSDDGEELLRELVS
jgi:hypothetical protein